MVERFNTRVPTSEPFETNFKEIPFNLWYQCLSSEHRSPQRSMMHSFADFGLLPTLSKTLSTQKLIKPTEIQNRAIPLLMNRQSVVGISETGSGKTLAYVLPILHALKSLETAKDPVINEQAPRAVVLAPTRDLGEQISRVFKTYTHDTRLRVRVALGGTAFEQARRNTADVFEVLLATPGRLLQMIERKLISLNDVRILVLDEADQMVDEGFLPATKAIAAVCPKDVQMSLFSATVSTGVQSLISDLFPSAKILRSSQSGKPVATLTTKNLKVEDGKRWPILEKLLNERVAGGTILFTNTREQCDKLAKDLNAAGYPCAVYRGEMNKNERRTNLKHFRDGKIDLLVSTDLAARGIDIDNVGQVINYHLPQQMQNYLHRAGRTARAGRTGLVVNLVTERDQGLIAQLDGNRVSFVSPAKSLSNKKSFPSKSKKSGSDRKKSAHGKSVGRGSKVKHR